MSRPQVFLNLWPCLPPSVLFFSHVTSFLQADGGEANWWDVLIDNFVMLLLFFSFFFFSLSLTLSTLCHQVHRLFMVLMCVGEFLCPWENFPVIIAALFHYQYIFHNNSIFIRLSRGIYSFLWSVQTLNCLLYYMLSREWWTVSEAVDYPE